MAFEEAFEIEVPDEDAEKMATVKDAVDYIDKHAKGKVNYEIITSTGSITELTRRVVVTGVGLVCALGIGTEESWKNLLAGQSGIRRCLQFDTHRLRLQNRRRNQELRSLPVDREKELKKMGRFIQVALAGADFRHGNPRTGSPPDSDLDEVGVYVASGIGGFDIIEREHWKLVQGGPGKISPFFIPSAIVNLASGHISIRYGYLRAQIPPLPPPAPPRPTPSAIPSTSSSGGAARNDDLRRHRSHRSLPWASAVSLPAKALSPRKRRSRARQPSVRRRPRQLRRRRRHRHPHPRIPRSYTLQKRNAPILAEIVGYGMAGDAYHITQPAADGGGAYRVMRATPSRTPSSASQRTSAT